jgi:hypothetical protein
MPFRIVGGGGVVAVRHQQVGLEQDPLLLQALGQVVLDLGERVLGLGR